MEIQVFVNENQALLTVPGGDLELLKDAQVVAVSCLHRQTCYFRMCVQVHMCVHVCVVCKCICVIYVGGCCKVSSLPVF